MTGSDTMSADLLARLATLTPEQRARFETMLAAHTAPANRADRPVPGLAGPEAPLSYQQERIWYLSQIEPDGGQFNVVMALDLAGPLDLDILGRALTGIVARQDALRTTVHLSEGRLVQRVAPVAPVPVEHADGTDPAAAAAIEKNRAFDLSRGPLLRACVVTLAAESHVLLLTVHHLAFDGWSAGVLSHELRSLYTAYAEGESPDLTPPPLRYADFATWQRGREDHYAEDAAYWKRQLAGAPHTSTFPGCRPRPPTQSFRGDTLSFEIPAEVVDGLANLARSAGATLFMVLHAALSALLARYGAGTDVVIGAPVANRTRPGLDDLIGCFINLLPLRLRVQPGAGFQQLVAASREVCLDAYHHQDLPYERLLQEVQVARDRAQSPLFQVMLVLHNAPPHAFTLPGLHVGYRDMAGTSAQVDLAIAAVPRDGRLDCGAEFSTDLYDRPTVARIVEHWCRLLAELVRRPDAPIGDLPLVTAAERDQLDRWASGPQPPPGPQPSDGLVARFDRQVSLSPDATALIMGGKRWSYRRLAGLTGALSAALAANGTGPESIVAVGLPRSPLLIAALLAVLRRGAAFLAVDPDLAAERRSFMIRDSRARAVLTTSALSERFAGMGAPLVLADESGEHLDAPPPPAYRPDALAYLVYTSGSTGVPKAVMGTHGSLLNRLAWGWRQLPFAAGDVCVQKTSVSFVDSIAEFFTGLLAGVPTVILDDTVTADVDRFVEGLAAGEVTRVVLVPSLLRAMLAMPGLADRLPRLRVVVSSGEALDRALVDAVLAGLPGVTLLNLYGSSEVGADVTAFWCDEGGVGPTPIGRPIDGLVVRVLDDRFRPVPPGVPGALLVGGRGLSRGYAHRGGLTAARFVPDPWGNGERLYRTGDQARWRANGTLEFLGRRDDQVKIRGVRVEPGEVETALAAMPEVSGCAVVPRRYGDDVRLVAFVVPVPGSGLDADAVRRSARRYLPELLLPSVIALCDDLPLTPTGKVDREALRLAPVDAPARGRAPGTATERLIERVWCEVLGLSRVGADDNFFDLGGHSLLVTRLAARLTAALGRDVTPRAVVDYPSVAELAGFLEQHQPLDAEPAAASGASLPKFPKTTAVRLHRDRLDARIESGHAPRLDAAALTYLPDSWIAAGGVPGAEFDGSAAMLGSVFTTPAGRIGVLVLPCGGADLFVDEDTTVSRLVGAVEQAGEFGARAVSLTGLLPSASRYGAALADRLGSSSPVTVSTGHPVTASAVTLTLTRALRDTGRELPGEHVCALGLGSIGTSSLRLLLATQPHPAAVTLCDLEGRRVEMDAFAAELRDRFGYRGELRVLPSRGPLPAGAYAASVIIGATSVAGVVDVAAVASGTILVDDSYPHCFDVAAALHRMATAGDVLFVQGGLVRAPAVLIEDRYLPSWMASLPGAGDARRRDPYEMMGCTLAAGLQAAGDSLRPTLGLPDHDVVLAHFTALADDGYRPARLQCAGRPLPEGLTARVGGP
jgi:amino acid adenylation domain-containing protein